MTKAVDNPRMRPLKFTMEQRRRHCAQQVAPGDEAKQSALRGLPLFDVALRGGLALGKPWKAAKAKR